MGDMIDRDAVQSAVRAYLALEDSEIALEVEQIIAAITRHLAPGDDLVDRLLAPCQNEHTYDADKEEAAERISILTGRLAKDAKAHEKEIAVWSENYAAVERRLARIEGALQRAVNGYGQKMRNATDKREKRDWQSMLIAAVDIQRAALTDGGSNG